MNESASIHPEYTQENYAAYCEFIKAEGFVPSTYEDWVEWNEAFYILTESLPYYAFKDYDPRRRFAESLIDSKGNDRNEDDTQ